MSRSLFAALAAFSLTAGCASAPPVDELPALQVEAPWKAAPAAGQMTADSGAQWWLELQDDELTRLMNAATEGGIDLQIALARRDAARAAAEEANAEFWPTLRVEGERKRIGPRRGAYGGDTGTEDDAELFPSPTDRGRGRTKYHSIGLQAAYEVDLWGRVRAGAAAGRAELVASEHDVRSARVSLTAETATLYFTVRASDALLALRSHREELLRDIVRREQDRLRAGVSDADALLRAERDLLQLQENNAALLEERAAAENRLAVLLGHAPMQFTMVSHPDWEVPAIEPQAFMPAEVLELRPDIAAMGERVRAANARVGEARAVRLPQLSLTGAAGYASEALSRLVRGDSFGWSFGPALELSLFDGGRLAAREQVAIAQAKEARAEYRQAALRAFEEVENALTSLDAARAQERSARNTVESLGKSSALLRSKLTAGRIARLPLLATEAEKLTARERALHAQLDSVTAYVSLMRALGR